MNQRVIPRERMNRREFLQTLIAAGLGASAAGRPRAAEVAGAGRAHRLFLCGDVMTGRGFDQILPHPSDPVIHEAYLKDAREYLRLAEAVNGPIPKPVAFTYPWGPVPGMLDVVGTRARIINLETAVTAHPEPWPGKGINYRMHPGNVPVINALGTDVCVLANNHVLDWRAEGLRETLNTLQEAGLKTTGAGLDAEAAREPAVVPLAGDRRLLIFAFGLPSSGVPAEWAAGAASPGLHFLPDFSDRRLKDLGDLVESRRREGDVVLASVHWGGNWGYEIPRDQRRFAHGLIDEAGVDLVHGHSSHHPKGMEVHEGRLILYGCGDFINDYEGITGHDEYRPDLVAMYLPLLGDDDGNLRELLVVPLRIARMRLHRATMDDARWLAERINSHQPAPGQELVAEERGMAGEPTSCLRLQWHTRNR